MELKPIPREEKDGLRSGFFHEHQRELSAFDGHTPGPDGLYPYPYFDLYWTEARRRFPFWIVEGADKVGFVFLRLVKKEESPISRQTVQMAEFYLIPQVRGTGMAQKVLDEVAERAKKLSRPLTWTCYAQNTPGKFCYNKALKRFESQGFKCRNGNIPPRGSMVDEVLYLVIPPGVDAGDF